MLDRKGRLGILLEWILFDRVRGRVGRLPGILAVCKGRTQPMLPSGRWQVRPQISAANAAADFLLEKRHWMSSWLLG